MTTGFAGLAMQKELGLNDFSKIPNGAPGVETRLMLLHEGVRAGRLSLNRFVEVSSTAPAKMFGLFPKKGTIAVGTDGDIVLFDPQKKLTLSHATLHQRVDYTPYEGREVIGAPTTVLSRGAVVVRDGQFVGQVGNGRFVKRGAAQL